MTEEEQLKLERDTAILIAKERLTEIEDLRRQKEIYELKYLKSQDIIKEVREYIKKWQEFPHTNGSTHKELKNLMDILDKENRYESRMETNKRF